MGLTWVVCAALCGCSDFPGFGNVPADYPPPPLYDLGLHQAPAYVARVLQPARGIPLVLAHPRLGQPAIRTPGETFDVSWIAPALGGSPMATADAVSIELDGAALAPTILPACDGDGICNVAVTVPAVAPGVHELCVTLPAARVCSPSAVAVVTSYADPATIIHFSDAHVGDGDSETQFAFAIDRMNALDPPADFAIFTGDGANNGSEAQRMAFVEQLARLQLPVFVTTGNHDYDDFGIDDHLLDVGPELDYAGSYGALRVIGLSSGQDLDNGHHVGTISISSGPDDSQLDWLELQLMTETPTILFQHHPIYNGLFATVGPARDRIKSLVTRSFVLAVLAGHTHVGSVFDADGNSRALSLDGESSVPLSRLPLHYTVARVSTGGGFTVFHAGEGHLDYRWVAP